MSEVTRGEILDIIGKFAFEDADYRKKLLANPKEVLAKQMNRDLPDNLKLLNLLHSCQIIMIDIGENPVMLIHYHNPVLFKPDNPVSDQIDYPFY